MKYWGKGGERNRKLQPPVMILPLRKVTDLGLEPVGG